MSIHNRKDDYIDILEQFESNFVLSSCKKIFLNKYLWDGIGTLIKEGIKMKTF